MSTLICVNHECARQGARQSRRALDVICRHGNRSFPEEPSKSLGLFWYSGAWGWWLMSGIHRQELGIWQYVQGAPQAGARTAVGGDAGPFGLLPVT